MHPHPGCLPVLSCLLVAALTSACSAQLAHGPLFLPEARRIRVRDPSQLPHAPMPDVPPPRTVSDPQGPIAERPVSLDEAIRIALENAEVVRVLSGVTASSTGQTIYDPAIVHTTIDQQQAVFDPAVRANNTFSKQESADVITAPLNPDQVRIDGTQTGTYNLDAGVSKTTLGGATTSLNVNTNRARLSPDGLPLNPRTDAALEASVTQPLLEGAGRAVNLAPIVLARIDTERSYFQLKNSVQQLVRGVIEAYWALVFARTDLWARNRQSAQAQQSYERAQARYESGLGDLEDVAQSRLAYANFRANLIAAQANVLQREAALRNILGLPPDSREQFVPTTVPRDLRLQFDWQEVLRLAEENRPDIIELKLILEADRQQILIANNQALPSVDAFMLYRWNGVEGITPARRVASAAFGELTDWSLGVNFSVPLGLRAARARLRQRELILAADRANLGQALHSATHLLALTMRNVDQNYEQYLAFQDTRLAARTNLDLQLASYNSGLSILLNVLQAITDWGNAVSAEAQALTTYNIALAEMELQTGTILETHGVRFYEERMMAIGPLGRWHRGRSYPSGVFPAGNVDRYEEGTRASEQFFDLEDPLRNEGQPRTLPPPPPLRLPPPLDE